MFIITYCNLHSVLVLWVIGTYTILSDDSYSEDSSDLFFHSELLIYLWQLFTDRGLNALTSILGISTNAHISISWQTFQNNWSIVSDNILVN